MTDGYWLAARALIHVSHFLCATAEVALAGCDVHGQLCPGSVNEVAWSVRQRGSACVVTSRRLLSENQGRRRYVDRGMLGTEYSPLQQQLLESTVQLGRLNVRSTKAEWGYVFHIYKLVNSKDTTRLYTMDPTPLLSKCFGDRIFQSAGITAGYHLCAGPRAMLAGASST